MKKIQKIKMEIPRVVLLGRTNVGKSTLFNKLAEKYEAMVSDIAGTTRDIKSSAIHWQGHDFELFDTGGLNTAHLMAKKIKKAQSHDPEDMDVKIIIKALEAVKQADLILFLVDVKDGLLKEDKDIAIWLKKQNVKTLLIVNKADGNKLRQEASEFYKLGLGDPIPTSAASGSGAGDLLDEIVDNLEFKPTPSPLAPSPYNLAPIKVSIIGRPNVGKSSLLNKILGEDRVIVSSKAHTTREPIDIAVAYKDQEIILVDTAGIRRKSRIRFKSMEKEGVTLSFKSLDRSDITLLVIDPSQRIGQQDLKLAHLITNSRTGVIIVNNKLDLLEKEDMDLSELPLAIEKTFNDIKWAPIMLISALTGKNVHKLLDLVLEVNKNRSQKVDQTKLDSIRKKIVSSQPPPRKKPMGLKGTRAWKPKAPPKIVNIKQTETSPPHFEIVYRGAGILPLSYLRYLEKGLRDSFDFTGTPIIIHQKKI